MTIRIIDADDLGNEGYVLTVDLDADNAADPAEDAGRIVTYAWGSFDSSKNAGETRANYLKRIKDETRGLAKLAAGKRGDRTAARTKVESLVGASLD